MLKEELIEKVLELELKMFLSVPVLQESSCRDYPDSFRMHRKAQFLTWSESTIKSYLNDLKTAGMAGKNLMTIKYARMDNLIRPQSINPLIKKITKAQYKWQIEMFEKYPHMMKGARPVSSDDDSSFMTSFETYLAGELETYSDKTLELLYKDIIEKIKNKVNMAEEVYEFVVKSTGYNSLDHAEEYAYESGAGG